MFKVLILFLSLLMNVFYTKEVIVTEVIDAEVTVIEAEGECWAFFTDENSEIAVNDKLILLMSNNNTADYIYDDIIVNILK